MSIPDPNFPKIKSTLDLQSGGFLTDVERDQLFQSRVGAELSQILYRCQAYRSKMETAQKNWENAQAAEHKNVEQSKSIINEKRGQFAVNHREYKSCLIGIQCRERMEDYQQCWDLDGPDVIKEITQTGQFHHGNICRAEKLAIERCMGNLVSRSVRSASGSGGPWQRPVLE